MKYKFDIFVVDKLVVFIKCENIDIIYIYGYKLDIFGVWVVRKVGIFCVVILYGFENVKDIKLRMFIWLGC